MLLERRATESMRLVNVWFHKIRKQTVVMLLKAIVRRPPLAKLNELNFKYRQKVTLEPAPDRAQGAFDEIIMYVEN